MNSITIKIIDYKAGCYVGMSFINHVLYSDDIA